MIRVAAFLALGAALSVIGYYAPGIYCIASFLASVVLTSVGIQLLAESK